MKAEDEYTHKSRSIFVCESNDDTDDDVTDNDDSNDDDDDTDDEVAKGQAGQVPRKAGWPWPP